MSRIGKCTNHANCAVAYDEEPVTVPDGAFVCPGCGLPLAPLEGASSQSFKPLPTVILGVLVLLLCAVFYVGVKRAQKVGPEEGVTAAPETVAGQVIETDSPVPPPGPAANLAPETASSVPDDINLDPQAEQNAQVKSEVLKRIDLMPTISSEDKDKLYFSVERARQMGKIVKIPFGFGQRTLSAEDVAAVKAAFESEKVRKILADPTAVLVLLGYADARGDDDKNLKISQDRAEAALRTLRDRLRILNVMHAVGMGSSTLFDETGNEKNRVVEVWVVLP